MFETLLFSVENQIATIAFNRPEALNSFNKKMADELEIVTEEVRLDQNIRAVLLKGAGNMFMAGGDLKFFYDSLPTMPKHVMTLVRSLNVAIINFMHMPKPVLCSVHGSVAGAGISLMSACDLIIASEDTKFTLAYSGIGISPDGGATYNLPRIVGAKKAMEWLMLSDLFDAKTALTHGLVNWVVPQAELAKETDRLLQKLVSGPTKSYAHIKRLVNDTWQNDLTTQLELEGRAFSDCSITHDFKTGVNSFLKKQKPVFEGK